MIYIYQIFIPKLWPSTNKEDDDEPKPRVFEWMRKMLFLVQFLEIGWGLDSMRELRFHLGGSSLLVMRKLQGTFAEPYIRLRPLWHFERFGCCSWWAMRISFQARQFLFQGLAALAHAHHHINLLSWQILVGSAGSFLLGIPLSFIQYKTWKDRPPGLKPRLLH